VPRGINIVAGIGGLLYQKLPGGTPAYYYYHYDGSGNVTAITDADKDVAALYEYDAFGNIITKAGTLANDFTFSTQMAYGASGWSMYMFRNYSPRLGRWTQRDPIGFAGGALNLYEFCGNNPVHSIDVLGLKNILQQFIDDAAATWCGIKKDAQAVGGWVWTNIIGGYSDGTLDTTGLEDFADTALHISEIRSAAESVGDAATSVYEWATANPGRARTVGLVLGGLITLAGGIVVAAGGPAAPAGAVAVRFGLGMVVGSRIDKLIHEED
jgi:RHS repeat-associated protein